MDFNALYHKSSEYAERAHEGQTDRSGKPYISHPIIVSSYCTTPLAKICAMLHDTIEDTDVTEEDLRREFGDEIADVVVLLTHHHGEDYLGYIHHLASNPTAREVKLADLRHNMDLTRTYPITEKDVTRLVTRYVPAYNYLRSLEEKKKP